MDQRCFWVKSNWTTLPLTLRWVKVRVTSSLPQGRPIRTGGVTFPDGIRMLPVLSFISFVGCWVSWTNVSWAIFHVFLCFFFKNSLQSHQTNTRVNQLWSEGSSKTLLKNSPSHTRPKTASILDRYKVWGRRHHLSPHFITCFVYGFIWFGLNSAPVFCVNVRSVSMVCCVVFCNVFECFWKWILKKSDQTKKIWKWQEKISLNRKDGVMFFMAPFIQ